jgi:hypothetical protein
MPTPTYDLIASNVLGSASASITFSSIPTTGYRDFVLVANVLTESDGYLYARINNDTGTNYSYIEAWGQTTQVYSSTSSANKIPGIDGGNPFTSATNRALVIYNFMDANVTSKHKTVLTRVNQPSVLVGMSSSRWANTSAITSITVFPLNSFLTSINFSSGSSFYLYGIAS